MTVKGAVLAALVGGASAVSAAPKTWCNPLPMPDYPLGIGAVRGKDFFEKQRKRGVEDPQMHRALADPAFLWDDGKFYVFPTGALGWRSDDCGGTWVKFDAGEKTAPAVAKHRGKYYLMGCSYKMTVPLMRADSPEGPFKVVGTVTLPKAADGSDPLGMVDPALLSDDDRRLYLYWGCSQVGGFWGCELDAANPTNAVGPSVELLTFTPQTQPWEGKKWNRKNAWLEGCWCVKAGGKYHLVYSASGTENPSYAFGDAVCDTPLGKYEKRPDNPFFQKLGGLVTGTGHGSIVRGPDDDFWLITSILVGRFDGFERMVGMDRLRIDANGWFEKREASETPQWLSGSGRRGPTGWIALEGRSDMPEATDGSLKTFWDPKGVTTGTIAFAAPKTIRAFRLIWRELDWNWHAGVRPGANQYRVEFRAPGQSEWKTLHDASANATDLMIDYRETPETVADAVRLVILGGPKGVRLAVTEFTAFGTEPVMTERLYDGWECTTGGRTVRVAVPHDASGADASGYRRTFVCRELSPSGKAYLIFRGARQLSEILVNGKSVELPRDAVSEFVADVTRFVCPGENELKVTAAGLPGSVLFETREGVDGEPVLPKPKKVAGKDLPPGTVCVRLQPSFGVFGAAFNRSLAEHLVSSAKTVGAKAVAVKGMTDEFAEVCAELGVTAVDDETSGEPLLDSLGLPVARPATKPAKVSNFFCKADRDTLPPDGESCAFVEIGVVDPRGVRDHSSAQVVSVAVEDGSADVLSVDNGERRITGPYRWAREIPLKDGRALAVVRRHKGAAGGVTVVVRGEGIYSKRVTFK